MTASRAEVTTPHAGRYLQQLCKHWSHKFDVAFDERHGVVPFPEDRRCEFRAEGGILAILLTAPDEPALRRFEEIVENHLRRFAFREELEIAWEGAE